MIVREATRKSSAKLRVLIDVVIFLLSLVRVYGSDDLSLSLVRRSLEPLRVCRMV